MSTDRQTAKKLPPWQVALLIIGIAVGCLGGCFGVLVESLRPAGALLLDAMFAAWMAFAARGAGWRRIAITGVLVFAALVGIELAAFVPPVRRVGFGVIAVVLCVSVALLMRAAWPARLVPVTCAVVMAALGGFALQNVRTVLAGALLFAGAAGVTIYLILGLWVRRHARPTRRRAAAFAVLAAVLIPLGALGFIANSERQGGAYAGRYGTQVTVITSSVCEYTVYYGTGMPDNTSPLRCPAQWEVNGEYRSGTAVGDGEGFGPGESGITAFAVDGRAWHTSLTQDDGLTLLAHVAPGWLVGGVVVGLAIAVWIALTSMQPNLARPFVDDRWAA
jgi:hypothetical protein